MCNMRVCMVEDGAKDKLVELDLLQKIFLYSVKRMVIFVNTRIDHSTLKADGCVTWELGELRTFWNLSLLETPRGGRYEPTIVSIFSLPCFLRSLAHNLSHQERYISSFPHDSMTRTIVT